MPISTADAAEFIRILHEQPELQAELREIVWSAELSALRSAVQGLAEAQRRTEERVGSLEATIERLGVAVERLAEAQQRTEERMDRLEAAVERLAEAQQRTEERMDRLEAAVERLAEAQQRTEERMDRLEAAVERLAEAQQRTEERVEELAEAQRRTEERMDRLEAAVERLAEAQRRTEERVDRLEAAVERLAEAQQRTEERVEELAEAQRRTEERVDRLEAAVERLAEAQQRTEERVEELAEAQRRTEEQVQKLGVQFADFQNAFGATVEEEAESNLRFLLEDRGYRLVTEPYSLPIDGEIDVIMAFEDPDGEKIWAVVEAKARLGYRQVQAWAQRMHSRGWHKRLAAKGVPGPYLVYAYGIRTDRGAIKAAESHGIGLLTGRGERVAPKGLIREPSD